MKSYTDIEQSKTLTKILPFKSADMYYREWKRDTKDMRIAHVGTADKLDLPCWSLAALLGVLPSRLFDATPKRKELYLLPDLDKSYCFYRQFAVKAKGKIYLLTEGEYLIDACVAMIEKLHELNLL